MTDHLRIFKMFSSDTPITDPRSFKFTDISHRLKAKTSTLIIFSIFSPFCSVKKSVLSRFWIHLSVFPNKLYIKCYIFVSTLQINFIFFKSSSNKKIMSKNVSKLPVLFFSILFLDQLRAGIVLLKIVT